MDTRYTKTRTVTVKKKDVYFDIDYLSWYYAHTSAGDDAVKGDAISTETDRPGGRRIVKRLCDRKASDLKTELEKFLDVTTVTSADDTYADANWVFNVRITTEAEDNIFPTLADYFHHYIVDGALAAYYAEIGVQGNRESLQKNCADYIENIRRLVFHRPQP
jgi:hypothetical protein